MFIKQFLIILTPLFLGYFISTYTHLPLPSNVIGLVILFLFLIFGIVKLKWVEETAEWILRYLALFFVVPTVGIMVHFNLLSKQAVQIFVPLLLSILIGLFVSGKVTELLIRKSKGGWNE
ncbi:MAG: CidA/LrgA family protein [Eubacteriales bacterium]